MAKNNEQSEENESDRIVCGQCDDTFNTLSERRQHVYSFHQNVAEVSINSVDCEMKMNENAKYTCVLCKRAYKGFQNLRKHFKKKHSQYQLKTTKRKTNEFSFAEGCSEVLSAKKIKSELLADSLDLTPSSIIVKDDSIEYNFFTLLNKASLDTIKELGLVNKPISCVINAHTDEVLVEKNAPFPVNPSQLEFSHFPHFQKKIGEYRAISEDLEKKLNTNSPSLALVADLFAGSLMLVENLVIFCVTVEAYSREFSHDVHAENNSMSYPEPIDRDERYYDSIKTIIIEESQGKQIMNKLIIGTTKFNILVTCTVLLSPQNVQFVSVGPSCHNSIHNADLRFAQILLRKSQIDDFINGKAEKENINFRQLMSAFDHKSTYFSYRSSIFKNILMQPQTTFTIGDVPGTAYGISIQNNARLISVFFKTIGHWIYDSHVITLDDINQLKLSIEKNDDINILVSCLEAEYNNDSFEITSFLQKQKGLSKLAQSLSGYITTANKKVEQNLMSYFAVKFGKK